VRPNDGFVIVTWTAKSGLSAQSTQLGDGVLIDTLYGVPGKGHPAAIRQADPTKHPVADSVVQAVLGGEEAPS
jgi:hypothetical protein